MQKIAGFLDSYRNRYLILAVALTLVLVLTAMIGYLQVQRTSYTHIDKITSRAQMSMLLASSLADLNDLQKMLQDIVIEPDLEILDKLSEQSGKLTMALEQLDSTVQQGGGDDARELIRDLLADLDALNRKSSDLVAIRIDDARWFPATTIMEDRLLPNFLESLTLLGDIARELRDEFTPSESAAPLSLVQEMRMDWVSMTAQLRLYVANRFGVFSVDSESGMSTRNQNVESYRLSLKDKLAKLEALSKEKRIGFIGRESLPGLERDFEQWTRAKDDLVNALQRDDWRTDLVLLRHDIYPIIERMQSRISSLQLEMDIQSAGDITSLTDTAKWLAFMLLAITGAIILITFAGYLSFNRLLLRPISETTHALMKEASGESVNLSRVTMLRETRDLADAFHKMQLQVRSRQDRLDHLAHHDVLTQLPNRVLFNRRLEQAIQQAASSGRLIGLMFLDLDRFKQINDTLGHGVGDLLLREVSMRLTDAIEGEQATIARFGGDEFTIIVEDVGAAHEVELVARKILSSFETKFLLGEHNLHISTSIGIALAPRDARHASDLLRAADTAMYEAKQRGRNQFCFHSEEMSLHAHNQMELENELRRAVERNEFEVYYQPIIEVKSKRLAGFESLLRWNHPQRGLLTPIAFLAVLEDSGLIAAVTDWLLDQTAIMQRLLRTAGHNEINLSINLTARLMNDDAFAAALEEKLNERMLNPDRLIIELTEDALTGYIEKADVFLRKIRRLGVRLALDDFGTGQSSLEHLRRFSFDVVKIDRSFVGDISSNPDDASLVDAVIKIGHSFGMKIVAEGVETQGQLRYIAERNCDYLQGFLISEAVPANEALKLARRYRRPQLVKSDDQRA
jgi:diguanylate cyclase (GGDEF)-like protein